MENNSTPAGKENIEINASVRDLGHDEVCGLDGAKTASDNSDAADCLVGEMITAQCIPSMEFATGVVLRGISPDRFDPGTGMILGYPGTPEQLAALENMAESRPVSDLIRSFPPSPMA